MKNLYLLIIFLLFTKGYSQQDLQNANWTISNNRNINFNLNSNGFSQVAYDSNNIYNPASVSDQNGNLLFYTNGVTVWNASNNVMPNGTGLLGAGGYFTQNVVIVPNPLDIDRYYIITISTGQNSNPQGLRFSEVDMKQDNNNGDVIQKNIPLKDSIGTFINETYPLNFGKITTAKHSNGKDYWLLAEVGQHILTYLIDNSGIHYSSKIESPLPTNLFLSGGNGLIITSYQGPFKVSPNNDLILIGYTTVGDGDTGRLYVGVFDNTTGVVNSNFFVVPHGINGGNFLEGAEFSPNQEIIHFTLNEFQMSFLINVQIEIIGSGTNTQIEFKEPTIIEVNGAENFQRAIDGKIYFISGSSNNPYFLSVINSPQNQNDYGIAFNSFDYGSQGHGAENLPPWVQWQPCRYTLTTSINPLQDMIHEEREDWIKSSDLITFGDGVLGHGVIYHAGNYVDLIPGFDAVNGSQFTGYIEGCTNNYVYKNIPTSSSGFENINPIKTKIGFSIIPNPSSNSIDISMNGANFNKVIIASIDGKIVDNINVENKDSLYIDISYLKSGVYLVSVTADDGKIYTEKLIKR